VAGERDRPPLVAAAFGARARTEVDATEDMADVEGTGAAKPVEGSPDKEVEGATAVGDVRVTKVLGELPGTGYEVDKAALAVVSLATGTEPHDEPPTPDEVVDGTRETEPEEEEVEAEATGAAGSSASVSMPSSKCKNRLKSRANLKNRSSRKSIDTDRIARRRETRQEECDSRNLEQSPRKTNRKNTRIREGKKIYTVPLIVIRLVQIVPLQLPYHIRLRWRWGRR
jgi:hypothetical protein